MTHRHRRCTSSTASRWCLLATERHGAGLAFGLTEILQLLLPPMSIPPMAMDKAVVAEAGMAVPDIDIGVVVVVADMTMLDPPISILAWRVSVDGNAMSASLRKRLCPSGGLLDYETRGGCLRCRGWFFPLEIGERGGYV